MSSPALLSRYKAWANARTFQTVSTLSSKTLLAPRESAFGSILATLNHSYVVDVIFRAHIEGKEHGFTSRNSDELPSLNALTAAVEEMDLWWCSLSVRLTDKELTQNVSFNFVDGRPGRMTLQDIIFHIVNHATYHRGYVDEMLYSIAVLPPTTDYPVFLRDC